MCLKIFDVTKGFALLVYDKGIENITNSDVLNELVLHIEHENGLSVLKWDYSFDTEKLKVSYVTK